MTRFALALAVALAPSLAAAGDPTAPAAEPGIAAPAAAPAGNVLSFRVLGGAAYAPDYFGSDTYSVQPDFNLGIENVRIGRFAIGQPGPAAPSRGFGLHGAARFVSERSSSDNPELRGLDKVDASLELGLGLHYETEAMRAFADLRYGVIGHNTFVGDAGVDLILRPTDRLTLSAGPRVSFGSGKFADTYFGVTPDEAVASGLPAYNAAGGILGLGAEIRADYALNDLWSVEGTLTYNRLQNSGAESPITGLGSRDQYSVRLGVSRQINLNF